MAFTSSPSTGPSRGLDSNTSIIHEFTSCVKHLFDYETASEWRRQQGQHIVEDSAPDREAYQTVYAKARGAIAAPTAGFHFTERVFEELGARGVETCEITLHVGLGTFQPVHTERVEDHKMETEQFEISQSAAAAIEARTTIGYIGVNLTETLPALHAAWAVNAAHYSITPDS